MPLPIMCQAPTLCIRRAAYEKSGLSREEIDGRLGLTVDEFRVEGDLVAIGPIYGEGLNDLFNKLETMGLRYYEDYFELSGNWPAWLSVFAAAK
ncbi:MAG: hypothetical protein ACREN3_00295 [Gemmatimonadaceae bacterium]